MQNLVNPLSFKKIILLGTLSMSFCLSQISFGMCQDSANKIDILKSIEIPVEVLKEIIPKISQIKGTAKFTFQIHAKDNTPFASESLRLTWKDGERELKTDTKGKLTIGISPENMQDLQLAIPAGATCMLVDSPIKKIGPGARLLPPMGKGAKPMNLAELFSSKLVGKNAPEIKLEGLSGAPEGTEVSIESLRGKVIVLDFWATWCKPCIMGFPHLNELNEELGDDFVFISITDEDLKSIEETLEKHSLNTWVGVDTDGSVFEAYDIKARPTIVVIDKNGKVAAVTPGSMLSSKALKDVADGKPWPKIGPMLGGSIPVDISPKDISSDYEITIDDLIPGGPKGLKDFLDQIAGMKKKTGKEVSGEIQLTIQDSVGESKAGFPLILHVGQKKTTLTTNDLGNISVELTRENHKNLRLLVPAGHRVIKPEGNLIMGKSRARKDRGAK